MSCVTYQAAEQPPIWERVTTDDIFIKQLYIAKAGSLVPQHSHKYSHTTLLVKGSVRIWKDLEDLGVFYAPDTILIPAHTKHRFLTLEDDTLLYCIHNVMRQGFVEIAEEHNLDHLTKEVF